MDKTGLLVCEECWDPDHPQNHLGREPVNDPQALRNPRPDKSLTESRFGMLGEVFDFVDGVTISRKADQDVAKYYSYKIGTNVGPESNANRTLIRKQQWNASGDLTFDTQNQFGAEGTGLGTSVMDNGVTFSDSFIFEDMPNAIKITSFRIPVFLHGVSWYYENGIDVPYQFYNGPFDDPDPLIYSLTINGYKLVDREDLFGSGRYRHASGSKWINVDLDPPESIFLGLSYTNNLSVTFHSGFREGVGGSRLLYFGLSDIVYTVPPSVRGPDWDYTFYSLDSIAYVGTAQLAAGFPDEGVMTQDKDSGNAIVKPSAQSGVQTYCFDYNALLPAIPESRIVDTGLYKKVEMRIRFIKPSSIGNSDFSGTREWLGEFKWQGMGNGSVGDGGCSITVSEPDFFTLHSGEPEWMTITWDSKNSATSGAWEDYGPITAWRLFMYTYTPSSGTQQSDCFEVDYIRFLEV